MKNAFLLMTGLLAAIAVAVACGLPRQFQTGDKDRAYNYYDSYDTGYYWDTGSYGDSALWLREVEGNANISPNKQAWENGTETWYFFDQTNNRVLCRARFDTSSTSPLSSCDACTFAFNTRRENLVGLGGDCDAFGWPDPSGDVGFDFAFGFAPVYTLEYDGSDYEIHNALMYYYDGSGGSQPAQWIAISYDVSTFNNNSGRFVYELFPYEFYYYPY